MSVEGPSNPGLRAFFLRFAVGRLFRPHVGRRERPAHPDDHGDHVDVGSEQIEVAGHFAQRLTLAGEVFRRVDGVFAFRHAAGAGSEYPCLEPIEPGALRVARKLPLDVLSASVVIRRKQFDVGHLPQGFQREAHGSPGNRGKMLAMIKLSERDGRPGFCE